MPPRKKTARAHRAKNAEPLHPHPIPTVGATLVTALDGRWEKFLAELRRNRRRCTEPSIHDLRVATRRMIATLDVVGAVLPGGVPAQVRRRLKRLLKSFNELRDLHIQLMHFQALRPQFPVLQPFLAALRLRERELIREAARTIAEMKTHAMQREIARVAESLVLVTAGDEAEQAARAALLGALAATFVRAAGLRKRVAPAEPESIHALRVAFKKFRYTVEVLAPLLPEFGKKQYRAMNAYQTSMGEIQDLQVIGTVLTMNPPGRFRTMPASLLPVHQQITQQRAEQVNQFMRNADMLLTFWQPISRSTHGPVHSTSRSGRPARK